MWDLALDKCNRFYKTLVRVPARVAWGRRGPRVASMSPEKIRRVTILLMERIGDMVVALPLFERLRQTLPHAHLTLITTPLAAQVMQDDRRVDELIVTRYFKNDFWEKLSAVRDRGIDVVIDLNDKDSNSAVVTSMFLANRHTPMITLGKGRFGHFYDANYPHDGQTTIAAALMRPLRFFGGDGSAPARLSPLFTLPDVRERVESWITQMRQQVSGDGLMFGLNVSAGEPQRVWSASNFVLLGQVLHRRFPGSCCVIICAPAERATAVAVAETIGRTAVVLPEGLSLQGVAALIGGLDLLVSSDTAPVHIARAYLTPVVALYRDHSDNLAEWRPYGQRRGAVVSSEANGITTITADMVIQEIEAVLAESSARPLESTGASH